MSTTPPKTPVGYNRYCCCGYGWQQSAYAVASADMMLNMVGLIASVAYYVIGVHHKYILQSPKEKCRGLCRLNWGMHEEWGAFHDQHEEAEQALMALHITGIFSALLLYFGASERDRSLCITWIIIIATLCIGFFVVLGMDMFVLPLVVSLIMFFFRIYFTTVVYTFMKEIKLFPAGPPPRPAQRFIESPSRIVTDVTPATVYVPGPVIYPPAVGYYPYGGYPFSYYGGYYPGDAAIGVGLGLGAGLAMGAAMDGYDGFYY